MSRGRQLVRLQTAPVLRALETLARTKGTEPLETVQESFRAAGPALSLYPETTALFAAGYSQANFPAVLGPLRARAETIAGRFQTAFPKGHYTPEEIVARFCLGEEGLITAGITSPLGAVLAAGGKDLGFEEVPWWIGGLLTFKERGVAEIDDPFLPLNRWPPLPMSTPIVNAVNPFDETTMYTLRIPRSWDEALRFIGGESGEVTRYEDGTERLSLGLPHTAGLPGRCRHVTYDKGQRWLTVGGEVTEGRRSERVEGRIDYSSDDQRRSLRRILLTKGHGTPGVISYASYHVDTEASRRGDETPLAGGPQFFYVPGMVILLSSPLPIPPSEDHQASLVLVADILRRGRRILAGEDPAWPPGMDVSWEADNQRQSVIGKCRWPHSERGQVMIDFTVDLKGFQHQGILFSWQLLLGFRVGETPVTFDYRGLPLTRDNLDACEETLALLVNLPKPPPPTRHFITLPA